MDKPESVKRLGKSKDKSDRKFLQEIQRMESKARALVYFRLGAAIVLPAVVFVCLYSMEFRYTAEAMIALVAFLLLVDYRVLRELKEELSQDQFKDAYGKPSSKVELDEVNAYLNRSEQSVTFFNNVVLGLAALVFAVLNATKYLGGG